MKARAVGKVHETVVKLLANEKRGKILDAAAGEGALSKELMALGFPVCPIDIDSSIFELRGIECKKIDLNERFPYSDESFDYVVSVETLEHLWNPYGAIREFHRILKPGGKLILTTPNVLTVFSRVLFLFSGKFAGFLETDFKKSGHITPIPIWQLKQNLKEIGFAIKELTFNRGYIPILHLEIPFKNLCFGQILIVKALKV